MLERGPSFFEKCLLSTTYVDFTIGEACNAQVDSAAAEITLFTIRGVNAHSIDNVFPF
jgi:hypothetical protein